MKSFGKATAVAVILLVAVASSPRAAATSRGGPAFTSGGDFPGETSCTTCHYYKIDTGPGEHQLEIDNRPASEFAYVPGETVSVILRFQDPEAKVSGFLLTARTGDGCDPGGTFETAATELGEKVKVREGSFAFRRPEPCGDRLNDVQWTTHSLVKEGTSIAWEMLWTPPATYQGPVTIAYAINGADGNGSASFDSVYFGQLVVPGSTLTLDPPMITSGGLGLEGLAEGGARAAPGAIASLGGEHFAVSDGGRSSLDESGRLTTSIDGVCVEVGQHRAALFQVTADRILFEIPPAAGLGLTSVRVIRFCDTQGPKASEPVAFTTVGVLPDFLEFDDGDAAHLAAVRPSVELVAAAGAVEGHRTRPARPGDLVTVFGWGFGAVSPDRESGEVLHDLRNRASTSFRVMIGPFQVASPDLVYVGATPHYAGLQQFTVRLPPALPLGSHLVRVLADGVVGAAGPRLEVAAPMQETMLQACVVGLVLDPLDRCALALGDREGIFEIDVDGKACALAPSGGGQDRWTCGFLDLGAMGADVRIQRNDDGKWAVTAPPVTPPEEMPVPAP